METIYLFATILNLLTLIVAIIGFKFKIDETNQKIDIKFKEINQKIDAAKEKEKINITENIAEILTDLNTSGYTITRIDPDSVFLRNRVKR